MFRLEVPSTIVYHLHYTETAGSLKTTPYLRGMMVVSATGGENTVAGELSSLLVHRSGT